MHRLVAIALAVVAAAPALRAGNAFADTGIEVLAPRSCCCPESEEHEEPQFVAICCCELTPVGPTVEPSQPVVLGESSIDINDAGQRWVAAPPPIASSDRMILHPENARGPPPRTLLDQSTSLLL